MAPLRIESLAALESARRNRRAVICPSLRCFSKPKPAAFIINLSGEIILRLMEAGMFLYEKETNDGEENADGNAH